MDVVRGAVPSSDVVAVEPIKQALAAHETSAAAARDSDRALVLLERGGRGRAEAADAQATASAIARGDKDPGSKNLTKYERELVDARRRAGACKLVEERRWTDVETAFSEHGPELQEVAEKQIEAARSLYLEAVDQLDQAHARLGRLLPWQQFFATEGMAHGIYRHATDPDSSLLAPHPHALDPQLTTMSSVLAALRSVGAPPPPPPITNPHQELVARSEGDQPLRHMPLGEQGRVARIAPSAGPGAASATSRWP